MRHARPGWQLESYRHSLAARGVRTGRGYFAKGNRLDSSEVRSLLAQPKRDARGNILKDALGRPLYPTKEELGLPKAPVRSRALVRLGSPEAAMVVDRERVGAPESQAVVPTGVIAEEFAAPPIPMQEPTESMVMTRVPSSEMIERAEQEALQESAFDTAMDVGAARIPMGELHERVPLTPGVPPPPESVIEETSEVQP